MSMPDIGSRVAIRGPRHEMLNASRIEEASDDRLVVTQPAALPDGHPYEPGVEFAVSWPNERGLTVVPVRLAAARVEVGMPLWYLEITGEPWVEQRREFVRTPISGAVRLTFTASRSATFIAPLLDLSEAGLRCSMAAADAVKHSDPNAPLRLQLDLDGERFDLTGTLARRQQNAMRVDLVDLVAIFDKPVQRADDLRRIVFAEQLRARRSR